MAIFDLIAWNPEIGDPIVGTGGCRKLRVAKTGGGKSGGWRVVTFFSGPLIPAFLVTIYGKSAKDTLTKAERNALLGLTTELVAAYGPRIVKLRSRS